MIKLFCVNLDLAIHGEDEAKMVHKPGARSPCCAVGHR